MHECHWCLCCLSPTTYGTWTQTLVCESWTQPLPFRSGAVYTSRVSFSQRTLVHTRRMSALRVLKIVVETNPYISWHEIMKPVVVWLGCHLLCLLAALPAVKQPPCRPMLTFDATKAKRKRQSVNFVSLFLQLCSERPLASNETVSCD